MFAGHVGAALAIGRSERRVNVGAFVAAALLLDVVLWIFILMGWEAVAIPSNFADTHQAEFTFPYSHGLIASLGWSILAGAAGFAACTHLRAARWRVAVLLAAAVFSHWVLDALVHQPELPLAGAASARLGLGLWRNMPVAIAAEAAIVIAGLLLFLPGCGLSRGKSIGLAAMTLVILGLTVMGMTVAPAPPSARAMAGSSLIALVVVCALAFWLGRRTRERASP